MYNSYYTTTANYYDSAAAAGTGLAAGLIIFFVIIALIGVAVAVFEVIALAKMFKKAGREGWKAIIPVYNIIVLLDIIGYKWYYIFVYCATAIPVIGSLVVCLFGLTQNIKLSKSFGKTTGFGIGLWLVGGIFVPIIAFNKNIKYVGPAVNGDIDFNDLF